MVAAPEAARIDVLERRAIWLVALGTVAIVFGSFAGIFSFVDDTDWWKVALVVASQAGLVASLGLACLCLVPGRAPAAKVERVLLWAFALFWLALFLSSLNLSISLIQAVGEPGFG